MMPLILPKFPPQVPETHAQREIRGFREQAAQTARRDRRAFFRAALLSPILGVLALKRKAARTMPRRPKRSNRPVT